MNSREETQENPDGITGGINEGISKGILEGGRNMCLKESKVKIKHES